MIGKKMTGGRSAISCATATVAVSAALFGAAMRADATSHTWTGGGTDALWGTPANWSGGAPPTGGVNTDLTFNNSVKLTNSTGGNDYKLSDLLFDTTAGAFIINSDSGKKLIFEETGEESSILNASASLQTINVTTIEFNNNISLRIGGAGNLSFGSNFISNGGITKTDAGTVTLTGTGSSYNQQLRIQQGTISIGTINNASSNGVLGNSSNAVSLGNTGGLTGTLRYTGSTSSSTKAFALATGGTGALDVSTGATTLTLSGLFTGSGNLQKVGAGTLVLSNTGSTYSGVLSVKAGTLSIGTINNASSNGALGNSANAAVLGDTGGVTGTLLYTGTGATPSSTKKFTMASGGTGAFNVSNTSTALTLSGVIDGSGNLQKLGSGTLVLSGINTYGGATTIDAGTLRTNGSAIPDASAVTLANVASAILSLNSISETIGSLAGGGAAGGNVTLGTATLTTGGDNTSTTYSGIISGSGGNLIKTGDGTMNLARANTFTGSTEVNDGVLELSVANALQSTSSININGGTLLFSGTNANRVNDAAGVTLQAGGTLNTGGQSEQTSQGLGTLTLTGTGGNIDFGNASGLDNSILWFAGGTYTSGTLNVLNWNGNALSGGGTDQFRVTSALNQTFLNNIVFSGFNQGTTQIDQGTYFEVVPIVPEPSTIGLVAALGALTLFPRRRRR